MKNNQVPVSIPDDLFFEILTCLPVKSLLRFKCVCQKWRYMISDPSFAEVHRSRSAASILISVPDMSSPYMMSSLVSLKDGEARRPIVPVLPFHRNISQSVNGFVCIYQQYDPSLRVLLYNPSTREHVTLPQTAVAVANLGFRFHCITLGFDPSTKTYKILRVWTRGEGFNYEIFTLGGGAWRIIDDGPFDGLTRKGICLDGSIYWADNLVMRNSILAFDVGEEKFRSVPTPPGALTWKGIEWDMIEIDGHIAIVDFHDVVESISNVIIMWKFEDPINGVWSQKRIPLPEFCIPKPLPITGHRPLFVTSIGSGELTLIPGQFFSDWYVFHYNLEDEKARKEVFSRSPENDWNDDFPLIDFCGLYAYKESVISLREICRLL